MKLGETIRICWLLRDRLYPKLASCATHTQSLAVRSYVLIIWTIVPFDASAVPPYESSHRGSVGRTIGDVGRGGQGAGRRGKITATATLWDFWRCVIRRIVSSTAARKRRGATPHCSVSTPSFIELCVALPKVALEKKLQVSGRGIWVPKTLVHRTRNTHERLAPKKGERVDFCTQHEFRGNLELGLPNFVLFAWRSHVCYGIDHVHVLAVPTRAKGSGVRCGSVDWCMCCDNSCLVRRNF